MKPVLLLIPGMLSTEALWRDVAERLRSDADVRIADVTTQDTIADMARDAWTRVCHASADTPLVVCGFSMGGYVAMEMVARPTRRVDALALLDTAVRPDSEAARARRLEMAAAMRADFERVTAEIAIHGTHPSTHRQLTKMGAMRAMFNAVGARTGLRQLDAILGRADHRAALAALDVPALVACGRDDLITHPRASAELAALIPGSNECQTTVVGRERHDSRRAARRSSKSDTS